MRLIMTCLMLLLAAATAAPPQRVVAIGDLHGDGAAWNAVAQAAGLIGPDGHWTGGATTLVQTGDIADRGPDSLRIIRQLMRLQAEAPRTGGRVIVLVGNHEAMNMIGDLRYVDPGEYAAFADAQSPRRREEAYARLRREILAHYRARDPTIGEAAARSAWFKETPLGWAELRAAWAPKGEIGRWVSQNPAVVKIGDSLYVHGGISAAYARFPIDQINRRVRAALKARDLSEGAIINDAWGPLWYRGLVTRDGDATAEAPPSGRNGRGPPLSIDEEIDLVLRAYGVRRIVVGHTPSPKGIVVDRGGRLIRIDTGMSRSYGGALSYLEIVDGTPLVRTVQRPMEAAR